MPLHCLIIGHANTGHASVFKHNRVSKVHNEPKPENVLKQFAEWADELARLENDPEFGIERVEYTADAAMVIAFYNREPSDNRVPNHILRDKLQDELRILQRDAAQAAGGYQAEVLGKKIDLLKKRLERDPINPVQDIASFILDKEQNPGLSDNERRVIENRGRHLALLRPGRSLHPRGQLGVLELPSAQRSPDLPAMELEALSGYALLEHVRQSTNEPVQPGLLARALHLPASGAAALSIHWRDRSADSGLPQSES